jgi:hypothetical protein
MYRLRHVPIYSLALSTAASGLPQGLALAFPLTKCLSHFDGNHFDRLRDGCMSTSGSGTSVSTSSNSTLRTRERRRSNEQIGEDH